MTRPRDVSLHARRGARCPLFRATRAAVLSALAVAGAAHAAVLTPEEKFDKEGRETPLDVFCEAAEFRAEHKVAFRVFYSFA